MRRLRENGLSLFFLAILLAALVGQAIAGHADYNNDEIEHAQLLDEQPQTLSIGRYVVSSSFGQAVMENWQSEYLQFFLFILTTVWLLQKGSPESKQLDQAGPESDEEQRLGEHTAPGSPAWAKAGGWRTTLYSNSLVGLMFTIFVLSWFAQAVTGRIDYNANQFDHQEAPLSLIAYMGSSDFWSRTLQNWQSEFLAVGSMAIFSVWWRARGSAQSKPVGSAHDATGAEG